MKFSWTAAKGNGTALDAYVIRAKAGPNTGQSLAVAASATSATMSGLAASKSGTFSLAAHSSCGFGKAAASSAVSVSGAASTYASAVLKAKPGLFYRMADSSPAVMADSSGHGLDGAYDSDGSVTLGTAGPLASDPSPAATETSAFLGQVNVNDLPLANAARTVEVWAQDTADEQGRPLVTWGVGGGDQLFAVTEDADGVTVNAGFDSVFLPSWYPLDDGAWHLITVVYNGTKLGVYVDGVSIGATAFTGTLDTQASGLSIGNFSSVSLADLAIYPTALTPATVSAHFAASGLSRPASAQVPHAAFGGTNAGDISWGAASAKGTDLTGYLVTALNGPSAGDSAFAPPDATATRIRGLAAGSYAFRVQAVDSYGLGAAVTTNTISVPGTGSTYASVVLKSKPSMFYRMADSSLPVMADSSGHGLNGFYDPDGTVSLGTAGPLTDDLSPGATETSAFLGQVNVNDLPLANASRTVEVWAKDTADEQGRPLVTWGVGGGDQLFAVTEDAGGVTVNAGFDSVFLPSEFPLDDGVWHLITVVYNGTKLGVYVDGVSIGTTAFTGTLDTQASPLSIGNFSSVSLANLAIYPTALTPATITAHFAASGLSRPAAVRSQSASGGKNQAQVRWAAAQANPSPVLGYQVTALSGGTAAGQAITVAASQKSATLTGLAAGSYAFRVQAVNSYGLGAAVVTSAVPVTGAASTYASAVQASKPSMFYRMADSSLTVMTDSSGHGLDGFYDPDGTVTLGSTGPLVGDPASAATETSSFFGQVNVNDLPLANASRTVEVWAKDTVDESGRPLVTWGVGGGDQLFAVTEDGGGVTVNAGFDSVFLPSEFPLNDGVWHLITVVYNGTKLGVYVDGVSIGTTAFTGTLDTQASALSVGNFSLASLANLAIYPTALTPATIAAHFAASGLGRPAAVTSPSASGGSNQAVVHWTDAPAGSSPVLGYKVTALAGGTAAGQAVTVAAGDTSATLTGLASGSYAFRVQAVNSYGLGAAVTTSTVSVSGAASTYASAVQASDPSMFYRMADSSLTVMTDSSGNGLDGFYDQDGTVTLGTAGPLTGDPAPAATETSSFLGQVNVNNLPLGNASRTVELWVQDTSDEQGRPLVTWGAAGGDQLFSVTEDAGGVTVNAGFDSVTVPSASSLDDGAWHLITVVYNGTNLEVYVDGASIGTTTFTGTLATQASALSVGNFSTVSLADLAIYPTALSSSTVAAHFSAAGDSNRGLR